MSQVWTIPILSTATLSDSRAPINEALATLQTTCLGTADPTGALAADGVISINTTTSKIKVRKAGAFIQLGDYDVDMGHLRKDGTIALTGSMGCGGYKLTNVGAPSVSTDVARKAETDACLLRAGDTLSANAKLKYSGTINLTDGYELAHKTYVDYKVTKTGDTAISGRLAYSSTFGSSAITDILRKDEIQDLASFNTSTGHSHTGSDSKRVLYSNISHTGVAANKYIVTGGSGDTLTYRATPWGYVYDYDGNLILQRFRRDGDLAATTYNLSSYFGGAIPAAANFVYLQIVLSYLCTITGKFTVTLRPGDQPSYWRTFNFAVTANTDGAQSDHYVPVILRLNTAQTIQIACTWTSGINDGFYFEIYGLGYW